MKLENTLKIKAPWEKESKIKKTPEEIEKLNLERKKTKEKEKKWSAEWNKKHREALRINGLGAKGFRFKD